MHKIKNFLYRLNIVAQAKESGVPLWQHPQFLFLIMGLIIIVSIICFYVFGTRYIDDPGLLIIIIGSLTGVLFIIDFVITQSFQALAETSRMKTEFIEVVSHQLRTPLSNLKWITEFLMSGKLGKIDERQVEYLGVLEDSSKRMMDMIRNLLNVAKAEEKSMKLNKENISFIDLVEEMVKACDVPPQKNNIRIALQADKKLPLITTDPFQLRIILENLLENAINYSGSQNRSGAENDKEILVSVKKKNKDVYFSIKDYGVGIPRGDQKYIFQKFFRSKNNLRYKTEGSGLGLYIVKLIVKRLGGRIGFSSKEGEGSFFWFTLPIK